MRVLRVRGEAVTDRRGLSEKTVGWEDMSVIADPLAKLVTEVGGRNKTILVLQ